MKAIVLVSPDRKSVLVEADGDWPARTISLPQAEAIAKLVSDLLPFATIKKKEGS